MLEQFHPHRGRRAVAPTRKARASAGSWRPTTSSRGCPRRARRLRLERARRARRTHHRRPRARRDRADLPLASGHGRAGQRHARGHVPGAALARARHRRGAQRARRRPATGRRRPSASTGCSRPSRSSTNCSPHPWPARTPSTPGSTTSSNPPGCGPCRTCRRRSSSPPPARSPPSAPAARRRAHHRRRAAGEDLDAVRRSSTRARARPARTRRRAPRCCSCTCSWADDRRGRPWPTPCTSGRTAG